MVICPRKKWDVSRENIRSRGASTLALRWWWCGSGRLWAWLVLEPRFWLGQPLGSRLAPMVGAAGPLFAFTFLGHPVPRKYVFLCVCLYIHIWPTPKHDLQLWDFSLKNNIGDKKSRRRRMRHRSIGPWFGVLHLLLSQVSAQGGTTWATAGGDDDNYVDEPDDAMYCIASHVFRA